MFKITKRQKGFTLIELLVVIAIIGMLSSIVLGSLNSARQKARDAQRVSDLTQIRNALELYHSDNNSYPLSGATSAVRPWRSECTTWGLLASSDVIPGLVPNYIPSFPSDPSMNVVTNRSCYLYGSNGTNYALLDFSVLDPGWSARSKPSFLDPVRDGGLAAVPASACIVDGTGGWAWKVYSSDVSRCW